MHRYFILYKPRGMVSQFISPDAVPVLSDLGFDLPQGIHAVGRLDKESEGLLLLTTNKKITRLLFDSSVPHKRSYLVLVKNIVSDIALEQLRNGISISSEGGGVYRTKPCTVEIIPDPAQYLPTVTPLQDFIPHTWLMITLTEGRFHQIRKMVFALHHRCKRLIRWSVEDITISNLQPGDIKELEEKDFFDLLKLNTV